MGWQVPRLPGLGDVDWARFFAALTAAHYDYVVSIEHEDRAFEGDEELVKRGFYLARDVLKPLCSLEKITLLSASPLAKITGAYLLSTYH